MGASFAFEKVHPYGGPDEGEGWAWSPEGAGKALDGPWETTRRVRNARATVQGLGLRTGEARDIVLARYQDRVAGRWKGWGLGMAIFTTTVGSIPASVMFHQGNAI